MHWGLRVVGTVLKRLPSRVLGEDLSYGAHKLVWPQRAHMDAPQARVPMPPAPCSEFCAPLPELAVRLFYKTSRDCTQGE